MSDAAYGQLYVSRHCFSVFIHNFVLWIASRSGFGFFPPLFVAANRKMSRSRNSEWKYKFSRIVVEALKIIFSEKINFINYHFEPHLPELHGRKFRRRPKSLSRKNLSDKTVRFCCHDHQNILYFNRQSTSENDKYCWKKQSRFFSQR